MAKRLKQKVGELIRDSELTYSKFARKTGISMGTAKKLYEDPYHNLTGSTLLRCAEFFGVEPGELVVEDGDDHEVIAPNQTKTPQELELIDKLFALLLPESLIAEARKCAGKDLSGFVQQAIAEKMERSHNADLSSETRTISNQIMVRL